MTIDFEFDRVKRVYSDTICMKVHGMMTTDLRTTYVVSARYEYVTLLTLSKSVFMDVFPCVSYPRPYSEPPKT